MNVHKSVWIFMADRMYFGDQPKKYIVLGQSKSPKFESYLSTVAMENRRSTLKCQTSRS